MDMRDLLPIRRKDVSESLGSFHREVDRLFDDFLRGGWMEPLSGLRAEFSPKLEVTEDDSEIRVTAELPGMDEKDIEVDLDREMLTIKGEKKAEKEEKRKEYSCSERRYGMFRRTIMLPDAVDRDKIQAEFKKGVLTVRLPKLVEAKSERKKIDIKGA